MWGILLNRQTMALGVSRRVRRWVKRCGGIGKRSVTSRTLEMPRESTRRHRDRLVPRFARRAPALLRARTGTGPYDLGLAPLARTPRCGAVDAGWREAHAAARLTAWPVLLLTTCSSASSAGFPLRPTITAFRADLRCLQLPKPNLIERYHTVFSVPDVASHAAY